MSSKVLGIVIGVLLIIGGIFYFFKDIITISYGAVCVLVVGIALFINYFKKKRGLPLVLGTYLSLMGLAKLVFVNMPVYGYMMSSVFFLSPGIIFLVLYFTKEKRSYVLTLGLILTAIGTSVILTGLFDFGNINIFFLCIGLAFVLEYIIDNEKNTKAPIVAGAVFIALSLRSFLNIRGYTDIAISFLLVAGGFAIIVKSLINQEGNK